MNPIILGGILKNFYEKFDMHDFSDRLRLQKIIYLMKRKGLNLGYIFSLYLYGPYSPDLTRDAFQISEIKKFEDIIRVIPKDKELQQVFESFIKYMEIKDRKNDVDWLEITSSYLFIKFNTSLQQIDGIIQAIKNKRDNFDISDEKVKNIIQEVEKENFFQNGS